MAEYCAANERSQFDTIRNDKKYPIDKNHAIGLPAAPVLEILNSENHGERGEGQNIDPKPKISYVKSRVGYQLDARLDGC